MRRKIVIVISSLQAGGAEKVASILANYWQAKGISITFILLSSFEENYFYDIDENIEIVHLDVMSEASSSILAISKNLNRVRRIRQAIKAKRPNLVLSLVVETNILVILSMIGMSIPLLVSDHADPRVFPKNKYWRLLRDFTYPLANRVVILDKYFENFYPNRVKQRCLTIPNPVGLCRGESNIDKHSDNISICAMGRFTSEKRFDLLLRIFSEMYQEYPNLRLILVGDGILKHELMKLCQRFGINAVVQMTGRVDTPNDYLQGSDIFFLTSESEGFPMALCEAMACGLPVVTSKYHSGVYDLVNDGIDGFVVDKDDTVAMKRKLALLIEDKVCREKMGECAQQNMQRFSLEVVAAQWELAFSRL